MKRYPMRLKILLLCVCAALALAVGFVSYEAKYAKMTQWQQAQSIDFDKETGSTKFQAIIDSSTNALLTFGVSAIAISSIYKFYKRGSK